jgi:DNA repair protein RecN (Recombination protein N)
MLMNLQVRDFAIVDRIDIEFGPGMTVLTGETGAGKSILVDALGLVLGERGNAKLVRNGAKRAEFAAEFDVASLARVKSWLAGQALDLDDGCLLRRVIGSDGRSRAFINGNAVPVSQLKKLGELLLDIHGQHFHQSLGHKAVQRDLLDHFGGLLEQRKDLELSFRSWQEAATRLHELQQADADQASRLDLLTFQLQELDSLAAEDGEYAALNGERQKLQNNLIADASRVIDSLAEFDSELEPLVELLNSASIQVSEATESLRRYGETVDLDPRRRDWVEERLDALQTVARKHRVDAGELPQVCERLRDDFDAISNFEERGKALAQEVELLQQDFLKRATAIFKARRKAAKTFSAAVTDAMSGLGMPGGVFEVALSELDESQARPWGINDTEFLISANPGQTPQPLARIASGGELSRMSLSIQVIASDGSEIPAMVFDEVDSGVGGGVAEMVGRRLQELGASRQVLCVTHLPQVASLADQHFRISKVSDGKSTRTRVAALSKEERIEELARMLGGVEITQKTLDHAAEMLEGAPQKRA